MHTKYTNMGNSMQHFPKLFDNGKLFFRTSLGLGLRKMLFMKHCINNSILYLIIDFNS